MAEGYIYVLFNPSFQRDQFKIGKTTKTPEVRAREISSATGVPRDFEVLYEERVRDCDSAERLVHQRLTKYRTSSSREFFELPLKEVIAAVAEVANEVGRVEGSREQISGDSPFPKLTDQGVPAGDLNVVSSVQKRHAKSRTTSSLPVTFEDHASYTDSSRCEILSQLRESIFALDDRLHEGEACTSRQRITYKVPGNKIFLEIKVQRSAIVLHLIESNVADPKGITDPIPETYGWGDLKRRIKILTSVDATDAMPFIEGAYKSRVARL